MIYKEPTREYKTFEVIWDEDPTTAIYERMDAVVSCMREIDLDIGQKIDRLGENIDKNQAEIKKLDLNLNKKIN